MSDHTPTRWELRDDPPQFEKIIYGGEEFVCRVYAGNYRDANAAFIVKAVNNHEALVKALEIARKWMPQEPGADMPLACSDLAVVDTALRNAIVGQVQHD